MKKGTKTIRIVNTGTKTYYVYDLDEDVFGKRKRIYGSSVSDVEEKIAAAKRDMELKLQASKPTTTKLSEYVEYYFKSAIGQVAATKLKRQLLLFKRNVFGSAIDINIEELTVQDITDFYISVKDKLEYKNLLEIDEILKKVFAIDKSVVRFNPDDIVIPDVVIPKAKTKSPTAAYILSPTEYEELKNTCIEFASEQLKGTARLLAFVMLTGIKISEMKVLTSDDFDLDNKTVKVGNSIFYLTDYCVNWLKVQLQTNKIEPSEIIRLFHNSDGKISTLQGILSTLKTLITKCGLPKGINGKTLYKSFIISELASGKLPEEICKQLNIPKVKHVYNVRKEYELRTSLLK